MKLYIFRSGDCHAIYDEMLDIRFLGCQQIDRASHVEPTETGNWTADLAPVRGPKLGPFPHRHQAIAAELAWLRGWMVQNSGGLLDER